MEDVQNTEMRQKKIHRITRYNMTGVNETHTKVEVASESSSVRFYSVRTPKALCDVGRRRGSCPTSRVLSCAKPCPSRLIRENHRRRLSRLVEVTNPYVADSKSLTAQTKRAGFSCLRGRSYYFNRRKSRPGILRQGVTSPLPRSPPRTPSFSITNHDSHTDSMWRALMYQCGGIAQCANPTMIRSAFSGQGLFPNFQCQGQKHAVIWLQMWCDHVYVCASKCFWGAKLPL